MVFTWDPSAPVALKATFATGFVLGATTFILSVWSLATIILSKKLRKPLWYFRASFCVKDIILCAVVLVPNLSFYSSQDDDQKRFYHPYLAAAQISAIASFVFTLLCASVDRYNAATRPFRYHMGELMPNGVALTLIFNCWMIGIISSICVITDYAGSERLSYGILLQMVSLERWQKALLLGGITAVYCVSAYLLFLALLGVARQKRESRLRLESGQEEPIRSTRNSVSDDQYCDLSSTSRTPGGDRESDANKFLHQIEDQTGGVKKSKRKWSLRLTQSKKFFTPTTYRPSILRRIRNTWFLYAVVITWGITFFATMSPFYYIVVGGEQCQLVRIAGDTTSNNTIATSNSTAATGLVQSTTIYETSASCIISGICDCLILSQGLLCVITYIFADDIFRPRFLWPIAVLILPFRCCTRRSGSESTYTAGRKRTLSRNSNVMSFSF